MNNIAYQLAGLGLLLILLVALNLWLCVEVHLIRRAVIDLVVRMFLLKK